MSIEFQISQKDIKDPLAVFLILHSMLFCLFVFVFVLAASSFGSLLLLAGFL